MCGGTRTVPNSNTPVAGLSPRVRGNPPDAEPLPQSAGSIPACAGEPAATSAHHARTEVYPRVCGGTPRRPSLVPPPARVYPRVCGGTTPGLVDDWHRRGLSPRVRGNPSSLILYIVLLRSIPACAGEPWWTWTPTAGGWVYPRVCGGTPARHFAPVPAPGVYPRVCGGTNSCGDTGGADEGLSPRVRGNPGESGFALRAFRSIPACAGEPGWTLRCRRNSTVYPRVCGGTG